MVQVFNEIYTRIKEEYSGEVKLDRTYSTTNFPCIVISQISDTTDISTRDSGGEKFSSQTIRLEIYTTGDTKYSDCYSAREIIDSILGTEYGMNRIMSEELENPLDSSIYRWVIQYTYKINKQKVIYAG